MPVKKAIRKTKAFFHKSVQNLGSFLSRENQKFRRSSSLNLNLSKSAHFYEDFSENNEPHKSDKMIGSKKSTTIFSKESIIEKSVDSFENDGEQTVVKTKHDESEIKVDKKMGSYREGKGEPCSKIARGGDYVLARKMKELEMMETRDMDQVLDIQEVRHYYSCLTSPSYLDIVDRFYVDMHWEFPLPQPSKSITNSSSKLRPLKI